MNRRIWPKDKLQEFFSTAEVIGIARAELETLDDAISFRYALYGFRRKKPNIGNNIELSIDGTTVLGSTIRQLNVKVC